MRHAFLFMKKSIFILALVFACACAPAATVIVGSWTPTFKGVDLASGQQIATVGGEQNQNVLCWRVDLTDPDVQLFGTPHCTNGCALETLAENTSHFLEQYGLQAAINGGFYASSAGPSDSPLGTPDDVLGLAISQGAIVSTANNNTYAAAMLFTTNKQAFFVPTNSSPGTNTSGIYTAISGNLALLVGGINVRTPTPSDLDPRTAVGLSQDRRYLYLMTLDGRQAGGSDGTDFYNMGEWLKRFGAWDGINVDGGGSTTMVMANCEGKAVRLNSSSFVAQYGRERNVGHNFGVYARPLQTDIKDLSVTAGSTTATITWRTDVEATAQIEYGLTASYGSATALDSRLLKRHAATLNNLVQGSNYFFRVISVTSGGQTLTQACSLTTFATYNTTQVFGLTNSWKYNTNNFDGVNWKTNGFNDSAWSSGPGLLYALETASYVAPRNTVMPPLSGTVVMRTYYFRTQFNFSGNAAGAALTFSNYVDDGAVFHLNGTEIYRLRMAAAPTVIAYATPANGTPCVGQPQQGDAATTCPDVFTISGNLLTNLVQGTNVLAVETHNFGSGTADIVFGSALFQSIPVVTPPRLTAWMEGNHGTIFWNAAGYTLQRSADLSSTNNWVNVPGPIMQSPYYVTNGTTYFYRLKN